MDNRCLKTLIPIIVAGLLITGAGWAGEQGRSSALPSHAAAGNAPAWPPIRFEQKVVLIGRVPYLKLADMMKQNESLLGFLRKEMGVKDVRLVTSKDYHGVLESLSRQNIDFAWLGPVAYVLGKEQYRLLPIVRARRQGGSVYRGVIIVRKDSRLKKLSDLKGKTFAFVDPESASGYLYPLQLLKKAGVVSRKEPVRAEFYQKHDAVIQAVLERKAEAGGCLEDALTGLNSRKLLDDLEILGRTEEICSDVLVCPEDCPNALRDRFKEALLKSGDENPGGRKTNEAVGLFGFIPVEDRDFQAVREVLEEVRSLSR